MNNKSTGLRAPIPGVGLTSKLGSRPWQRPPEFSTLEETIPHYVSAIGNRKFIDMFADAVESGVPVTTLADIMIQASVMEGKHTIDVGVLVAPLVVEVLISLAESSDLEYTSGLEDMDTQPEVGKRALRKSISKMFDQATLTEDQEVVREEFKEDLMPKAKGLMAKRGE